MNNNFYEKNVKTGLSHLYKNRVREPRIFQKQKLIDRVLRFIKSHFWSLLISVGTALFFVVRAILKKNKNAKF